jgi:DNA-binding SARP family transcriptional activator
MQGLRLRLLGGFEAFLDEKPLTAFESAKTQALLVHLAVEAGHPHYRECLSGLLWPDKPEASARHNLSQTLHALRILFHNHPVWNEFVITPESVDYQPGDYSWLDLNVFDGLLQACELHGESEHWTCRTCLGRLEQAIGLYHGEFMEGFILAGCEAYEEWLCVRREEAHQKAVRVLEWLSKGFGLLGNTEKSLAYAYRLVALNPYDEAGHRQVMRLLAQQGRRSEAMAQYEICRAFLMKEIAADPDGETTTLYRQIRAQPEQTVFQSSPPNNLPASLAPLIGRQEELEQLCLQLTDPGRRLITVLGPGGSGKTRLALEACHMVLPAFPGGVYFIELEACHSLQGFLPTVALSVGLDLQPEAIVPGNRLKNNIRTPQAIVRFAPDHQDPS